VTFNKVKRTYLLGMVVMVVLALVSWFFLLSPRMATAADIADQQTQAEAVNAKSSKEIALLTKMKAGLLQERAIAAALAVKFPATADQPTLFRQIVAAAAKAGIGEKNVTSVGPAAPVLGSPSSGAKLPGAGAAAGAKGDGGAMASMAVSFNAKGTLAQMVAMLQSLEDLPRSYLIKNVDLASGETDSFTMTVEGDMFMYRAVPDPDATPTPQATPKPTPSPAA